MKISILCTDTIHPIVNSLHKWIDEILSKEHSASLFFDKSELPGGDILFLISCHQIIDDSIRNKYSKTLVLHASDLPRGRGWSPHVWAILDGANEITVSMFEAQNSIDSGAIWLKEKFNLEGHELLSEINSKLFEAELSLMTQAVEQFFKIIPFKQVGEPGEYMKKRNPADSRIDPYKSIYEQFNLLRVADSDRHPSFFDYCGFRYLIKIEKVDNE
ncbi:formyltransferase family protein [Candidatus Methylopumilus planktonicus]|uniref:formyltransferase family protein n=1 Tax=Candidatus Methylopumilus planktonicus TaxID=1581557 RepID=UPI003D18CD33